MMGDLNAMMGLDWMGAAILTSFLVWLGLLAPSAIGVVAGIRWLCRREGAFRGWTGGGRGP